MNAMHTEDAASTFMTLNPEDIYLCILAHYFVHPPDIGDQRSEGAPISVALLQNTHIKRRTSSDIAAILLRLLTNKEKPCLSELCRLLIQHLGPQRGSQLISHLIGVLQRLDSPENLSKLFEDLGRLVLPANVVDSVNAGVGFSSPLGLMLRRCRVSFAHMTFEAVCRLRASVEAAARQDAPAVSSALQAALTGLSSIASRPDAAGIGKDDGGPEPGTHGGLEELQTLLSRLSTDRRQQDYTAALAHLHRYFDSAGGGAGLRSGASTSSSATASEPQRGRYQSALLSLSALHAEMGHSDEALAALREGLTCAQSAGDRRAVGQGLAQLASLVSMELGSEGTKNLSGGERKEGALANHLEQLVKLLTRCHDRGLELHAPHIAVFARLSLARLALTHGIHLPSPLNLPSAVTSESRRSHHSMEDSSELCHSPSHVVMSAVRAARLTHYTTTLNAVTLRSSARTGAAPGQPPPTTPPTLELYSGPLILEASSAAVASGAVAEVQKAAKSSPLLSSAMWRHQGVPSLAALQSIAYVACHTCDASDESAELAYAQLVEVAGTWKGLEASLALSRIARETFPASSHSTLTSMLSLAEARRCLAEGDVRGVWSSLGELRTGLESKSGQDHAISVLAGEIAVQASLLVGDAEAAHDHALQLFHQCTEAGLLVDSIKALLLICDSHLSAGNALGCLPHLLSALHHAGVAGIDHLEAHARALLAAVWSMMNKDLLPQTMGIIAASLPIIDAVDALTTSLSCRSLIAEALLCGAAVQQVLAWSREAAAALGTAASAASSLGQKPLAARLYYLQAQVFSLSGCKQQRNEASALALGLASSIQ